MAELKHIYGIINTMQNITHSQNFLINELLVSKLVSTAGFIAEDIILDIGAGTGIITKELSKHSNNIIAIEIDPKLISTLSSISNISIVNCDFSDYSLPNLPFKTFSNIPFNKTAEIVKKLLNSENFSEGFLLIQKEAANKFAGEQLNQKNTMLSVIFAVTYEFEVNCNFSKSDFSPIPDVEIVLLHIKRRDTELIEKEYSDEFKDFVSFVFNKTKTNIGSIKELFTYSQLNRFAKDIKLESSLKPSEITIVQYTYLFNFLNTNFQEKLDLTKGYFEKNEQDQENIEKVHRTRNDVNWRKK